MTVCREELEALCKRNVYQLVDRPKGRKVTKNRWVFDVKTDGRKKARLTDGEWLGYLNPCQTPEDRLVLSKDKLLPFVLGKYNYQVNTK